MLEVTALPTEPQPLTFILLLTFALLLTSEQGCVVFFINEADSSQEETTCFLQA